MIAADTVSDVVAGIKSEHKDAKKVGILVDDKPAAPSTTVGELCTTPFRVVIDGHTFEVPLPPYTGMVSGFALAVRVSLFLTRAQRYSCYHAVAFRCTCRGCRQRGLVFIVRFVTAWLACECVWFWRPGGAYGVDVNESSLQLRSLLQKGVFSRLERVLRDCPQGRIPLLVRGCYRPPMCLRLQPSRPRWATMRFGPR